MITFVFTIKLKSHFNCDYNDSNKTLNYCLFHKFVAIFVKSMTFLMYETNAKPMSRPPNRISNRGSSGRSGRKADSLYKQTVVRHYMTRKALKTHFKTMDLSSRDIYRCLLYHFGSLVHYLTTYSSVINDSEQQKY